LKILGIISLNTEQIEILRKYGQDLNAWKRSEKGRDTIQIHRDHEKYFQRKFSLESIDRMTANEFAEAYKKLWASNMWGNKDWYIENKLLAWNGLEKIQRELKKLLYDKNSIAERFNEFKINVKGFGVSSLSEILYFVFPDRYCLWNDKPKTVLQTIGLRVLPEKYFKYQIHTGQEYTECVRVLNLIKDELKEFGVKDFIDLGTLHDVHIMWLTFGISCRSNLYKFCIMLHFRYVSSATIA
jgi:hypothetical protein